VPLLQNVLISMSDGIRIAADVYLPDAAGCHPAVLYMGPYRKDDFFIRIGAGVGYPSLYTDHGYAFVIADVRGTNNSEGITRLMFDAREQRDGYEMVEWIAKQPWCNGRIGMTGTSYGFWTSLLTAAQNPPHLKTVVPLYGSVSTYYIFYEGGLPLSFGYHSDYAAIMIGMQGSPPGFRDQGRRWLEVWKYRLDNYKPWGLEWFDRQVNDEYWQISSICSFYDRIKIPVLAIGGWWDRYSSDPLKLHQAIKGPTKVLIGPWQHTRPDIGIPGPRVDYECILRWFDYWLKDSDNGVMKEPLITYYAQRYGSPKEYRDVIPGNWKQGHLWPLPNARSERLYLTKNGGMANRPPAEQGTRSFSYDPTVGICAGLSGGIYGGIGMPLDQTLDEAKSLTFTAAPLVQELEITGILKIKLYFSSTTRSMGVIAKLCDVSPVGAVTLITHGYLNAAHRLGSERPEFLTPGTVYALEIEMKATSYVFEVGHRLRISITSAEFPSIFPTPEAGDNTIHYGGEVLSYVDIPVVETVANTDQLLSLKFLPPPSAERPKDNSFDVHEDKRTGELHAVREVSKNFKGPEGSISYHQLTAARVHQNRPAESIVESEATFTFEYDSGGRVESRGKISCRGTEDSIHVNASQQVSESSIKRCKNDWSLTYPRRYI